MKPPTRRNRLYRRRLLNISNVVYLIAFPVLLAVGWLVFLEIPTLTGALIALVMLALAAVNLVALGGQAVEVQLNEEAMEIRYLLKKRQVPYDRIERLHWRRRRNPLGGFRPRDILKIELKDGKWIVLDHMRGKLKILRGKLEERVYG